MLTKSDSSFDASTSIMLRGIYRFEVALNGTQQLVYSFSSSPEERPIDFSVTEGGGRTLVHLARYESEENDEWAFPTRFDFEVADYESLIFRRGLGTTTGSRQEPIKLTLPKISSSADAGSSSFSIANRVHQNATCSNVIEQVDRKIAEELRNPPIEFVTNFEPIERSHFR